MLCTSSTGELLLDDTDELRHWLGANEALLVNEHRRGAAYLKTAAVVFIRLDELEHATAVDTAFQGRVIEVEIAGKLQEFVERIG